MSNLTNNYFSVIANQQARLTLKIDMNDCVFPFDSMSQESIADAHFLARALVHAMRDAQQICRIAVWAAVPGNAQLPIVGIEEPTKVKLGESTRTESAEAAE